MLYVFQYIGKTFSQTYGKENCIDIIIPSHHWGCQVNPIVIHCA